MNWKPISEIPDTMKDGRPVWVKWNEWGQLSGNVRHGWAYWAHGNWWAGDTDDETEMSFITHYMPLGEAWA